MKVRLVTVIAVGLLSALGGGLVGAFVRGAVHADHAEHAAPAKRYQCPMHPTVIQDHPGECPICGMQLVEMTSGPPHTDPAEVVEESTVPGLATIQVDPDRQQLIGLRSEAAKVQHVAGQVRTTGRVAVDETRVRHVNVKTGGFVDRVYANFVGKPVRRGDPLFALYSPEVLAAEEELLVALRSSELPTTNDAIRDANRMLVDAARKKLALWDVPAGEVARLERTRQASKTITFSSPVSGVVTKKDVVDGMKLEPGAMPYEIVDLSSVWVLADVYESELRMVEVGVPATLRLKAFPERTFTGVVGFVDPMLDPNTRTVKVRLTFPNAAGELRPEMFGEVTLDIGAHDGIVIPADAVVDSGATKVVFVARDGGKFVPREVSLGRADGALVEVTHGIAAGERVVTHANFLVDSESRLRASLNGLAAPESARVLPATGHEGHTR